MGWLKRRKKDASGEEPESGSPSEDGTLHVGQRVELQVVADGEQIDLLDVKVGIDGLPEQRRGDAQAMVASSRGAAILFTDRSATVPLEIGLEAEQPEVEEEGFDHIVEFDLHLPSGRLAVGDLFGDEDPEPNVLLPGGTYRALYLVSGAETVSEDGSEGEDRYTLILWPGSPGGGRVVRKQLV